jgi:hypothetical protein
VAAGDITSYVTLGDVLDRACAEVEALEDPDAKEEVTGLVERLRTKALSATGDIMLRGSATCCHPFHAVGADVDILAVLHAGRHDRADARRFLRASEHASD